MTIFIYSLMVAVCVFWLFIMWCIVWWLVERILWAFDSWKLKKHHHNWNTFFDVFGKDPDEFDDSRQDGRSSTTQ